MISSTPSAAQPSAPAPAPTPAKPPVSAPPSLPPMPSDLNGAPKMPAPAPALPGPTPAAPKTSDISAETSGSLTVWVPFDAKVTVNGHETRSTGSRRQFVSHGLQAGLTYKYVVHAEVVRDGQVLEDTRTVSLTAGQITAVAFGFNTTTTDGLASVR